MKSTLTLLGVLIPLLFGATTPAVAQFSAPEARSFGMAGSYTARATGYEAAFWNPANLGLSSNPAWSFGSTAHAMLSNNALAYGEISDLYGEYLDDATKSRLLADVKKATGGDPLRLRFAAGVEALGVSIGRLAIGVGGIGAGDMEITPDALELVLFGNVGETGQGRDFDFDGTRADLWTFSGVHGSYAHPFELLVLPDARFSAGATLRFGSAPSLVRITERRGDLVYEPLSLDVVMEKLQSTDGAGSVFAADLGITMEWKGSVVLGVALANAVQSIDWDAATFELSRYEVSADYENISIDDLARPYSQLDPASRQRVDALLGDATLPRQLRLGALWQPGPRWNLSVDHVENIGGGLHSGWDRRSAAGVEWSAARVIVLRGGIATSFEQFALTAGLGLRLGPVRADLAGGRWGLGGGDGLAAALSLSFWPGS